MAIIILINTNTNYGGSLELLQNTLAIEGELEKETVNFS